MNWVTHILCSTTVLSIIVRFFTYTDICLRSANVLPGFRHLGAHTPKHSVLLGKPIPNLIQF